MKSKKKFTYVTRYLGISAVLLSYPAIAHAEDLDVQPVAIEEENEEIKEGELYLTEVKRALSPAVQDKSELEQLLKEYENMDLSIKGKLLKEVDVIEKLEEKFVLIEQKEKLDGLIKETSSAEIKEALEAQKVAMEETLKKDFASLDLGDLKNANNEAEEEINKKEKEVEENKEEEGELYLTEVKRALSPAVQDKSELEQLLKEYENMDLSIKGKLVEKLDDIEKLEEKFVLIEEKEKLDSLILETSSAEIKETLEAQKSKVEETLKKDFASLDLGDLKNVNNETEKNIRKILEKIDDVVKEKPEEKPEEKTQVFVSKGVYLRDVDGKVVAYLHEGELIEGIKKEGLIEFEYAGIKVTAHSLFVEEAKEDKPVKKVYTSRGVNVRDIDGNLVGYLSSGSFIKGIEKEGYIEITYKDKPARVYKGLVDDGRLAKYTSKGVRVRDLDGNSLSYINKGMLINGKDLKDGRIQIWYDGQKATVHKAFLEEGHVKTYISKGVNVRNMDGEIVGRLKSGEEIRGSRQGSLIEIDYKGEKATIHRSFVKEVK